MAPESRCVLPGNVSSSTAGLQPVKAWVDALPCVCIRLFEAELLITGTNRLSVVQEGGKILQERLQQRLQKVSKVDANLMTRMCGHYLNLTAIAEMLHMCAPCSPCSTLCCGRLIDSAVAMLKCCYV
jgi:hypothetical protein